MVTCLQGFEMVTKNLLSTGVDTVEQIIELVQQWSYYHSLPEKLHGFNLEKNLNQQESKLHLFCYQYPENHRAYYAYYDKATKEFRAHTVIGLFDFCDIHSIASDLAGFERALSERMTLTLENIVCCTRDKLGSIFCGKKILEYDWQSILPKQASGFQLFISPYQPVKIVNGSFIIIDYCDFETESSLTVYYNIFRDEFFSERRINRLPEIVVDFDAKTLEALVEKLAARLEPALSSLRSVLTPV